MDLKFHLGQGKKQHVFMVMRGPVFLLHLRFVSRYVQDNTLTRLPLAPVCQGQRPDGVRHLPNIAAQWWERT